MLSFNLIRVVSKKFAFKLSSPNQNTAYVGDVKID